MADLGFTVVEYSDGTVEIESSAEDSYFPFTESFLKDVSENLKLVREGFPESSDDESSDEDVPEEEISPELLKDLEEHCKKPLEDPPKPKKVERTSKQQKIFEFKKHVRKFLGLTMAHLVTVHGNEFMIIENSIRNGYVISFGTLKDFGEEKKVCVYMTGYFDSILNCRCYDNNLRIGNQISVNLKNMSTCTVFLAEIVRYVNTQKRKINLEKKNKK